jgi:hypothetical protein
MKKDVFGLKWSVVLLMLLSLMQVVLIADKAFVDYTNERLVINVVKNQDEISRSNNLGFVNTNHGELSIKPSFLEAFIFEKSIAYSIGVVEALYLLLLGIWLFFVIKRTLSNQNFNYQAIKLHWVIFGAMLGYWILNVVASLLMSAYVSKITNKEYTYDTPNPFILPFSLFAIVVLVKVLVSVYDNAKQLKQENDLTI